MLMSNLLEIVNLAAAVGKERRQPASATTADDDRVAEVGLLDSDHRRQLLALRELRMDVLDDAEELLHAQFDAGLIAVDYWHVLLLRKYKRRFLVLSRRYRER